MSRPDARPLRPVTAAQQRGGRGSVLGPDDGRRTRWWFLTLDCGHTVEREVRYKPHPSGRPQRQRNASAALPPPTRARCDSCDKPSA